VDNANEDDVEAESARVGAGGRKKSNVKVKVLSAACVFSTLLIFIRWVRLAEARGWKA
jgi:hypothetical protein